MEKVLVIDDSELIRAYVRVGLKKLGVDITAMDNASVALLALKDGQALPSLIFVDINMPGLNGYAFTRSLKNDLRFKLIPVIFITANDSQWDKDHAKGCGAADYITKPFTVPAIMEIIRRYIPA
jgi:CheY-like chemotaxis protein